jgi:hypothetical protein
MLACNSESITAAAFASTRDYVTITNISQQPTDFWLDTYTIDQTLDAPALISSLAEYSERIQESDTKIARPHELADPTAAQSLLFLRIQAAASYYSTNRTLMVHPEPVDVDISLSSFFQTIQILTQSVLDPFLLNVFPQSLAPFAIYFTVVAIGAWFLSGYIYRWLLSIAAEPASKPHTD